ncbi:hypothetical protein GCM10010320_76010 [Streptomyces caelestis]|nr:hypothetical protein GCM10010320_76010 [Streptomyces caelestis]
MVSPAGLRTAVPPAARAAAILRASHVQRHIPRSDQQAGPDRFGDGDDVTLAVRGGSAASVLADRFLGVPAEIGRGVVDLVEAS